MAKSIRKKKETVPAIIIAGEETFTNADRDRYYGKRIGDRVRMSEHYPGQPIHYGTVMKYVAMDNNRLLVKWDGEEAEGLEVAEWLTIVQKIEDIEAGAEIIKQTAAAVQENVAAPASPQPPVAPVVTQQLITASFKMELSRNKFEEALQRFIDLKVTEDNIPDVQDKMKSARGFLRKMETIKSNGKEAALRECRYWDQAFKDLSKPLEEELSKKQSALNTIAAEIQRKQQAAETERQRIAGIRNQMDNFIIEQSQAIAGAKTDDEIVRIQKLIGSNKANKTRYEEFLPEFVERCNALNDLMNSQKETIRELEKLAKQKLEAETKGDDATIIAIQDQEEVLLHKAEENKIVVQEISIKQAESTGAMETARQVYPTVKARHTSWKYELLPDQKSQEKALKAGLVELTLNDEKVQVLIETLKDTKQINVTDKKELIVNGVRIFLSERF